ncbi:MAG: hypothetical protein IPG29_13875 [Sphingobacteriales bacterium]|nr:hypothetical protein [Sphingobacteriales bacterium]
MDTCYRQSNTRCRTFNAGTGIFTAATNAAGDYAFTYTVTGIAPCAAATATVTVTIGSLAVPTAVVQSLATCAGTPNTAAFEAIPRRRNDLLGMILTTKKLQPATPMCQP